MCYTYIPLFLLVIWLLFCSLVLYKAVLIFLLIQHCGLDLCRSRVEKAPWKELSNFWLVRISLVVLYVIFLSIVKHACKGIYQREFDKQIYASVAFSGVRSEFHFFVSLISVSISNFSGSLCYDFACKIKLSLLCWIFFLFF